MTVKNAMTKHMLRAMGDKVTYGAVRTPGKLAEAGGTLENYWVYEDSVLCQAPPLLQLPL